MIGAALRDVRVALRSAGKRPFFTTIVVATLGLGIGANTAIFSVVHAFLLRELPYPEADRLVVIWSTEDARGEREGRVSYPDFEDWQATSTSFEQMGAFFAFPNGDVNLTGGADPERVPVARVTPGYFRTLGVPLLHGREFFPEETIAGEHRVVVLSHELWVRQFGGDPSILGRPVEVNGFPYTVVGITSREFRPLGTLALGEEVALWRPIVPADNQTGGRGSRSLRSVGRLRPGVSIETAQAELESIATNLERAFPDSNRGIGVNVVPLRDQVVDEARPALLALLGSVALVLLIACANVANLMLARGASRRREIAVRQSLGASRAQIVRQLLTESVLLGLLGGLAGVFLAYFGVGALRALAPADLPLLRDVGLDPTVLAFATGVAVTTGLVFGLLPALQASRPDLTGALKDGGRDAGGTGRSRIPNMLVVSELAVTLVLLVSAGLLLGSFREIMSVDPGFDAEGVLSFQLELPMGTKYTQQEQRADFFRELLARLETRPEVQVASMVSAPPMGEGDFSTEFSVVGGEGGTAQDPIATVQIIEPRYFEALGVPLVSGRRLTDRDDGDAPGVAVVNEAAARHWPAGAVGGRFAVAFRGAPVEVVGVVEDVRLEGLDEEASPTIYLPADQFPYNFMTVLLRTSGDPMAVVPAVREIVGQLDSEQPIHNVRTMDDLIATSVAARRFQLGLLGSFSTLALVLAVVGVYGVVAYTVSRRRGEIGVRMAVGADEHTILSQIVGESLKLALIGVAIGIPFAAGAARLLRAGLFGVGGLDPATYLTAGVLLVIAVGGASLIPAWRAASTDPLEALRAE